MGQLEAEALTPTSEFPLIMSSGRHQDSGVNAVMRNPGTYRYRNPDTMIINPEDAAALDITDGQSVRLVTKAGSAVIQAECTWQAARGYVMVPHHFGFTFNGKTIGVNANEFTSAEDIDEITGDPLLRYIPCRVEPEYGMEEQANHG
jgi:anaerobic selenocysteine-containing dehydrogenase